MNPCDIFRHYALFNQWANEELFAFLAENAETVILPMDASKPHDIVVILNNILWEDRLWMFRATQYGQSPHPVNKVLYPVFDTLRAAREEEDMWIKNFTHNLTAPTLDTLHRYRNIAGKEEQAQLFAMLSHIFDQQSYGRGKICHILSTINLTPPDITLSHFTAQKK